MPPTIGGRCEWVDSIKVYSAYSILTMDSDSFLSNSYLETYEPITTSVTFTGNRAHAVNCYMFGGVRAVGNIKDLMVFNCDIWQAYQTPGNVFAESVTTSQYRFSFVGCRFLAYTSNTRPLVKLDDHRTSGHRFVSCIFDESAAGTGLALDDAHDILVSDCKFGSGIGENANWHIDKGIDVKNSEGVTISDCQFALKTTDEYAVSIRENVESAVIQNNISRGDPIQAAFVVDTTDGATGPIDIIDNTVDDATVAIRTTRASGSDVVNGLTVRGNRVRDISGVDANGSGIAVAFAPDAVIGENRIEVGYLAVEDSDRPQIIGNIIDAPSGAGAAIDLIGTLDEAWIHGCALPAGGAAYGVSIGASVTNTEVRALSNNWRGAATADLDDSGTGTLT